MNSFFYRICKVCANQGVRAQRYEGTKLTPKNTKVERERERERENVHVDDDDDDDDCDVDDAV